MKNTPNQFYNIREEELKLMDNLETSLHRLRTTIWNFIAPSTSLDKIRIIFSPTHRGKTLDMHSLYRFNDNDESYGKLTTTYFILKKTYDIVMKQSFPNQDKKDIIEVCIDDLSVYIDTLKQKGVDNNNNLYRDIDECMYFLRDYLCFMEIKEKNLHVVESWALQANQGINEMMKGSQNLDANEYNDMQNIALNVYRNILRVRTMVEHIQSDNTLDATQQKMLEDLLIDIQAYKTLAKKYKIPVDEELNKYFQVVKKSVKSHLPKNANMWDAKNI